MNIIATAYLEYMGDQRRGTVICTVKHSGIIDWKIYRKTKYHKSADGLSKIRIIKKGLAGERFSICKTLFA